MKKNCTDCGADTFWLQEYYVVLDSIWNQVTTESDQDGMLCILCLEKRLGRKLIHEDFRWDVALNTIDWNERSLILQNRLSKF